MEALMNAGGENGNVTGSKESGGSELIAAVLLLPHHLFITLMAFFFLFSFLFSLSRGIVSMAVYGLTCLARR